MDIQELGTQLQKFADAQGLNVDVDAILQTMDAGDFVEINQAIDNNDNRSILKILQKYRARAMESYQYFSGTKLIESDELRVIDEMGYNELVENYHSFVQGALHDHSHLSLSEMKALVKEDLTSTLGNAITNNDNKNQSTVNPEVQAKMKQAELQKNTGNPNFNVTVPNGNGSSVEQVLGVDVGSNPEQSLVVTKDPNQANQVQVFGLNDVEPVQEDAMDVLNMAVQGADDELKDSVDEDCEDPTLQAEPEMQVNPEIVVVQDEEVPQEDDIVSQIMAFCSRLNGMR